MRTRLTITYVHWRVYKCVDIPTFSLSPLPTPESGITSFLFNPSIPTWKQIFPSRNHSSSPQYILFAMKLVSVSIVLAALLATAVRAAPVAEPQEWCRFPGQICGKSKRDGEAEAAAVVEPQHRWCRFPGQICDKTKRTADALDIVKREADAVAEPFRINKWCRFPGQICSKAKRAVEAIGNVKRSAEAVAEAMAFLDELTPEEYAQLEEEFDNSEE
ncbi:hypothetical protein BDW68DRAFT_6540 [Aspergillus falconensis]